MATGALAPIARLHAHSAVVCGGAPGRPARTRPRRLDLPIDEGVTEDDFDFEAPHHGLALSGDGRTLCAAGRASDYVALVSAKRMRRRAIIEVGDAPGWATTGPGGGRCFVPNNRDGTLSVISYRARREVARLPMGDGPKHIEAGRVPAKVLRPRSPSTGN